MSFPKYAAYKGSGVEWLGEIPSHWSVRRLKHSTTIVNDRVDSKPDEAIYLGLENIESQTGRLLIEVTADEVVSVVGAFQAGDVLFGKLRPYLAKVVRPNFSGVCTTELLVIRGIEADADFLFYQLLSEPAIKLVDSYTYGSKMPRVNAEQIGNTFFPLPPLPEQRAIAAFLDAETARIDALVAKQEALIATLQEKRRALISHAVTKGLDTATPMKDSGVPWLGEVPAHWEVKRLKHVASFVTSGSRGWAEYYSEEGPIFLRIGNLTRNSVSLDLNDIQRVSPPNASEGKRTLVQQHDILVSITADIGSIAVVDEDIGEAYVSQHIALVRPTSIIKSKWLGYCLLSESGKQQFVGQMYGGTKLGLGLDDVRNVFLPLPSLDKQAHIIKCIEDELFIYDTLIAKAEQFIALLREHRAALIAAAVTGQIDVRGYVTEDAPASV